MCLFILITRFPTLSLPRRAVRFSTTEASNVGCPLAGGISSSSPPYQSLLFQDLHQTPPCLESQPFLLPAPLVVFPLFCIQSTSPLDVNKLMLRGHLGFCMHFWGRWYLFLVTASLYLTEYWFSTNSCGGFSKVG